MACHIVYEINVELNQDCNLNCFYCKEHRGRKEKDFNITKVIDEINYKITDLNSTDFIQININGGEPFLYPICLDAICQFLQNKTNNFIICFCTNGTLFKDLNVLNFINKWKSYLKLVISIDGTKETHDLYRKDMEGNGTYDIIIDGIEHIKKIIPLKDFSIKSTFTHETLHTLSKGIIGLISKNITIFTISFVIEESFFLDDGKIIASEFVKIIDYIFNHNLENIINIYQINNFQNTLSKDENKIGITYSLLYAQLYWNQKLIERK